MGTSSSTRGRGLRFEHVDRLRGPAAGAQFRGSIGVPVCAELCPGDSFVDGGMRHRLQSLWFHVGGSYRCGVQHSLLGGRMIKGMILDPVP